MSSREVVKTRRSWAASRPSSGDVAEGRVDVAEMGRRPLGVPSGRFQQETGRAPFPDLALDQPLVEGSRRRVVTKTNTERFVIEDDVSRPESSRRRRHADDREGVVSSALRKFVAVLAGILAVVLCSAGAGLVVEQEFVGAFVVVAMACGLGVVAHECWSYDHG